MKLYRKQLHSVDDLRRECIRLNYKKKHAGPLDLFGSGDNKRKVDKDTAPAPGIMGAALSLVGGGPMLQTALSLAGPIISRMGKSRKPETVKRNMPKKILGSIVKDVLVSYITGKGIQVIVKVLSKQIKKRREAKRFEKAIRVPVRIK